MFGFQWLSHGDMLPHHPLAVISVGCAPKLRSPLPSALSPRTDKEVSELWCLLGVAGTVDTVVLRCDMPSNIVSCGVMRVCERRMGCGPRCYSWAFRPSFWSRQWVRQLHCAECIVGDNSHALCRRCLLLQATRFGFGTFPFLCLRFLSQL